MTPHFWNLTNHPIDRTWSPEQRAAAATWGGVPSRTLRDFPFPAVDPLAEAEAVAHLADATLAELQAMGAQAGEPVLVMGEHTLTFALVLRLRAAGFLPLSATTRREAQESLGTDGRVVKSHTFQFVRFRLYPVAVP